MSVSKLVGRKIKNYKHLVPFFKSAICVFVKAVCSYKGEIYEGCEFISVRSPFLTVGGNVTSSIY